MIPVFVELDDYYRGDTWDGITIGPILFDNIDPEYPLSACYIDFRDENGTLGYSFRTTPSIGHGEIIIIDSDKWEVKIFPTELPLMVGCWYWDFETMDSSGFKRTLYKGSMRVIEDITY